MDNNRKKSAQLGMPYGTANGRLRKMILFSLLRQFGANQCFRCGAEIETESTLSIEHKEPWLDVSVELFWDLENIAFSHLVCNVGAARRPTKIYQNSQERSRESSRKRGLGEMNEHDKRVRREAYARGDNPSRAKRG